MALHVLKLKKIRQLIIFLKNPFLLLIENYKSRSIVDLKQPTHNKTKSKYQIGLRADNCKEEKSTCGTHSGEEGREGFLLAGVFSGGRLYIAVSGTA